MLRQSFLFVSPSLKRDFSFLFLLPVFMLLSLMIFATPTHAKSESCDKYWLQKAIPGDYGYKERNGICEGLYESPVSADFELVSLVEWPLEKYAKGDTIELSMSDVSKDISASAIAVRAVSLRPRFYYRMDTSFERDEKVHWPVDVLTSDDIQLEAGEMGVLGWKQTARGVVYIPVKTNIKGKIGTQHPTNTTEVVVRSGGEIEMYAWRLIINDKPTEYISIDESHPPGEPIKVIVTWPENRAELVKFQMVAKPMSSENFLTQIFEIAVPIASVNN